ncbi:MAG TPA: hypothetical protein VHZ24_16700 [Pirellulales bacterium]|nr:hypothetical protein [Pirellulales bacterium]
MTDTSPSFTPDEQRVLASYRDPRNAGLGRLVRLSVQYAIAAGCFVVAAITTNNALWSLAVLAVFIGWMIVRILNAKNIARVMPAIIKKYDDHIAQLEATIRRSEDPNSSRKRFAGS